MRDIRSHGQRGPHVGSLRSPVDRRGEQQITVQCLTGEPGQPEVGDVREPLLHEQVFRLEISVHQSRHH